MISAGPKLAFQVFPGSGSVPGEVGDALIVPFHQATLTLNWDNVPHGSKLFFRADNRTLLSASLSANGSLQQIIEVHREERVWVELYAENGFLVAMTNPIFIKPGPD